MRHAIQLLERRLLFVTLRPIDWPSDLTPEIADFYGTRKNDVIVVTPTERGVAVTVNGVYTETSGGRLNIFANGGNDKIHVDLPDWHAGWQIKIHGGAGDDVIVGSMTAERIVAGDGNDYVVANGGRDTVYAEGGDDSVRGGGSSDLLDGGDGRDTLRGDAGNDNLSGGGEVDRLRGSLGNDTIRGGASKDFIGGESGNDWLEGDGGADVLAGGEGDDYVNGGSGDDHCEGNDGRDVLAGWSGGDRLFGGPGNDGVMSNDDFYETRDFSVEDADIPPGSTIDLNSGSLNSGLIGVGTGLQTSGGGGFAGQTVTGASTLTMYTYAGDAKLDGMISADDYGLIDNFVQIPGTGGLANGDFNYDGVVDAADYGIIDAAMVTPPPPA